MKKLSIAIVLILAAQGSDAIKLCRPATGGYYYDRPSYTWGYGSNCSDNTGDGTCSTILMSGEAKCGRRQNWGDGEAEPDVYNGDKALCYCRFTYPKTSLWWTLGYQVNPGTTPIDTCNRNCAKSCAYDGSIKKWAYAFGFLTI